MDRLSTARTALFAALTPVVPGRVAPYPPARKAHIVLPYVWIDQPRLAVPNFGTNTRMTVATFPVYVGYDGDVRAQVAGLDELVAQVWDACMGVAGASPTSGEATTVDVGGTSLRATIVRVDVTVGAYSLCLPTVTPVLIPPQPVPVNGGTTDA